MTWRWPDFKKTTEGALKGQENQSLSEKCVFLKLSLECSQRKSESEGVRGKAPRGAPSSAREVADLLSPVILKTFSYDPTSARPYPARVPRVPG